MASNKQPVVKTIIESFTRCFHPLDHPGNTGVRSKSPKHSQRPRKMASSSYPTQATTRLKLSGEEWDDIFERKSHSTDMGKRRSKKDVVARVESSAQRPDPDVIKARSLKRKLEIFRTRESSDISMPSSSQRRTSTPEDLVMSDSSEEEIANLTSCKRFACGMGRDVGPIASFAKLFNLGPQPTPFGLCLTTPVRTASAEVTDKFDDDQLTADEYISRHGNTNTPTAVTPELETSQLSNQSRLGEDDTITSTLYFDQKYAHVIQTRPPMPLFHYQAVPTQGDDLTRIIGKKHLEMYQKSSISSSPFDIKPSLPSSSSKMFSMQQHDCPPSPIHLSDKSESVSFSPVSDHQGPWRMRDPDILHNTAAEI